MKTASRTLLTLLALVLATQAAVACKCRNQSIQQLFAQSNDVVRHKVVQFADPDPSDMTIRVISEVVHVYTGCLQAGQRILITTPSSSAACGVMFEEGVEYVSAVNEGQLHGASQLQEFFTMSCMLNRFAAALEENPYEQFFLATRRVKCRGDLLGCANGQPAVQCLVNPCDVQHCPVRGSRCVANYCGSCIAEFSDESGDPICYFCDSDNYCGDRQQCVDRQCVALDHSSAAADASFAVVV